MIRKLPAIMFVAALTLSTTAWGGADREADIIEDHPAPGGTTVLITGDWFAKDVVVGANNVVEIGDRVVTNPTTGADLTISKEGSGLEIIGAATSSSLTLTQGVNSDGVNFGANLRQSNGVVLVAVSNDGTASGGDDYLATATLKVGGDAFLTGGTLAVLYMDIEINVGSGHTLSGGAGMDVTGQLSIGGNARVAVQSSLTTTQAGNVNGGYAAITADSLSVSGNALVSVINGSTAANAAEYLALMEIAGAAAYSGGLVHIGVGDGPPSPMARVAAATHDVYGSAIVNVDSGGVLSATSTAAADGYTVKIRDGGHIDLLAYGSIEVADNTAGGTVVTGVHLANGGVLAVVGKADPPNFTSVGEAWISFGHGAQQLLQDSRAILDLSSGDLRLNGNADGNATLNGAVIFGGLSELAAIYTPNESAQLTADGVITTSATTDIRFTGTLMQGINTKANLDATDAGAVALIDSAANGTNDNHAALLAATPAVQTLVGQYTLAASNGADLGGTNDGGNLYVTEAASVVDFSLLADNPVNHTTALDNFATNAAALGYGNYLGNGVIANAFGVAANESDVANNSGNLADVYRIDYAGHPSGSDASAGARYNYNFFKNLTYGYDKIYDYANELDGDAILNYSPNFVTDPSTTAIFHAANVGKVNSVARDVAMGMLRSVDGRFLQLRGQQAWLSAAVDSDYAYAARALACDYNNRVWAAGLGHWQDGDGRDGFAGYDYDGYGLMVGYDRLFGPLAVGASFGFEKGDFEDDALMSNDNDIDSYSFNLYALYTHQSGFFGSIAGGYTLSDADMSYRTGGGSWKEDYDTDTWYVEAKLGYDWKPARGFRLSPSIGLGYISAESDGHRLYNKSINDWTARYNDQKTDSAYLPIDLEIAYDWCVANGGTFTASVNGGYTYNFDDDEIDGTVFYNSQGMVGGFHNSRAMAPSHGHHTWSIGAGLKYSGAKWEVGAKYDYFHRADTDAHRVYGYVGFKF